MILSLYPHGGSGNHGCEAIVRSTIAITEAHAKLLSSRIEEDKRYGLQDICCIIPDHQQLSPKSLNYWKAFLCKSFGNRNSFDLAYYAPIIKTSEKCDIALSIGGDNYCYGAPHHIYLINQALSRHHVKTVLWGCSIEPNAIDKDMRDDLSLYAHIFARESITYGALYESGLKNISLIPDPAFLLQATSSSRLPDENKDYVGINISPMIIGLEKKSGITMDNYIHLIDYIINETSMNVLLIPHVVWSFNDDRIPLGILNDKYRESCRVFMVEDNNAERLKANINQCRFMIAARTHASIAAYSSRIPTIVLGYSVKSSGIAKDLFGTADNYVVPVQSLTASHDLLDAFKWLLKNENTIRNHYEKKMPEYLLPLYQVKSVLNQL